MKLLLSSLLLASLCALSSWSVSSTGTPAVTQTPDVSVAEGETVNISCCWTLNVSRIRVRWMKNQTNINNDTVKSKNHSQGFLQNASSHCSHLTFTNVTRKDSGRYVCMVIVEIPTLNEIQGNGTVITVMALKNPNDSTVGGHPGSSRTLPPLIISLAVVAPLLLISLVCFLTLRRRQASANAARVIYEVPHIDSEEVEMDKHSTSSSRGSSQWCQVPVYESCDYFERVVTKESG